MKLQYFKNWAATLFKLLSEIFRPIYLFLPGIFFLTVYYFIIVSLSQGQDMVMQAAEYLGPFVFTNISLLFWMMFAWFSSRLVSDTIKSKRGITSKITRHFPRILGYNVAVGLQIAALNLPTIDFPGKGVWLLWGLFIFHNLFYFLLDYAFNSKQKKYTIISIFCCIIYASFLIYAFVYGTSKVKFFVFDEYRQHIWVWLIMSLVYFILQIGFVKLVIWRRQKLQQKKFENSKWKAFYNILALTAFAIYLFVVFSPSFADLYGSLGCLLLAMGLWVGLVCYIKHKALLYNVRLTLPILIFAILIGYLSDPYDVDLEIAQTTNLYNKRSDIDTYLNDWLNNPVRYDSILKSNDENPYPVYLVIADGGASKSGYWVASVLSKLESEDRKNRFSTHLLSLAGASGGSVGNLAYYSLLVEQNKNNTSEYFKKNEESQAGLFMRTDFLTYTLARFLGPDLLRHLVPFVPMDDRAAALEDAMENSNYSPLISNYFKGTLDTIFDYKGKLPLVFINTTNLETGTPGVISNIKMEPPFTNRMDVLKQIDACNNGKTQKNIKLSTAVILGARFPYVSPAGEINNKYFVDGGYFDNSGGGITLELLQHIENRMEKDSTSANNKLLKKLRFKVIYISNGLPSKEEKKELHPLVNDLAAPLLTVLGTYGKQTNMSNEKLENYIRKSKFRLQQKPYDTLNLPMIPSDTIIPYPMNWVISDYNLKRIINKNLPFVKPKNVLSKK
ncbi:patatin-like phospholipase family protein [Flavobacterium sp. UBA7682]|uniref:patatin-like phospholipase family protein n=1 Tax=Flavobacterium sp. UBA7682 TaxID=1946560 RepID=UPI0025B94CA0|nr:patatin-like phospholipase family protein [Flavobacterium sp. UBA7682]